MQNLVNLTIERGPFERAPHFIKEGQIRGKNSDLTTMVNIFFFKRKEPLYINSQISLLVMMNMEELTHVHPILKNQELLALGEGYQIPSLMEPVQEKAAKVPKLNQEQSEQVDLG